MCIGSPCVTPRALEVPGCAHCLPTHAQPGRRSDLTPDSCTVPDRLIVTQSGLSDRGWAGAADPSLLTASDGLTTYPAPRQRPTCNTHWHGGIGAGGVNLPVIYLCWPADGPHCQVGLVDTASAQCPVYLFLTSVVIAAQETLDCSVQDDEAVSSLRLHSPFISVRLILVRLAV